MYTVIQSLTADGRDQSLDYKISGFHVPPGSFDAEVWRQTSCKRLPAKLWHAHAVVHIFETVFPVHAGTCRPQHSASMFLTRQLFFRRPRAGMHSYLQTQLAIP